MIVSARFTVWRPWLNATPNKTEKFGEKEAAALKAALRPIDFSVDTRFTEPEQVYIRHYGVDLPELQNSHHFGYVDVGGFRLACHCLKPENPEGTVLILHGYFDHSGLYRHVMRFCLERNLAVMMPDLPGHGLSSGEQVSIDRYSRYREVFAGVARLAREAELPRPWYLLGQSMGAGIAMDYVLHQASTLDPYYPEMDRLFLLGPLVRPRRWLWVKYAYSMRRRFITTVPRRFSHNSSDPEFLQFLREDDPLQPRVIAGQWVGALIDWQEEFHAYPACDIPTLVVQGDIDGTVDWRYNLRQVRKKFRRLSIVMVEGMRHHKVNEAVPLRSQIFEAIDEELRTESGS